MFDMRKCMKKSLNSFDWNRARAFFAAAEAGSYSGAARALGVAQPTVGRQVAALEEELGVTLFERVGRGLELTPSGLDLMEHVREMAEAAQRLALVAAGRSTSLSGRVAISASQVDAYFRLPPIIGQLRSRHPGIEIELVVSNQASDLQRREADIALRSFRPKGPELVARKLGEGEAHLYAAPGYLDQLGRPVTAEKLSGAAFFAFDENNGAYIDWLNAQGLSVGAENFGVVTASQLVQWELCKAGQGVCIMTSEVGDAEAKVERALPSQPAFAVPLWLTTHRAVRTSRRVRVVFDLLAEALTA